METLSSKSSSSAWTEVRADEVGEAIVEALTVNGIDHLFFTSGSDIAFYQEAIAKAKALGRKAPRIITVPHEHVSLNAALGYAAVSGKPAATAVHVDVGTQHQGGAVHSAWRSGLPVVMTAGAPPTAYSGSMPGSREAGGNLWAQQVYDQNAIVRQYTKWDHRLDYQDNAGLIVSRAIQAATTEPCGPVYLSLPSELTRIPIEGARFPTAAQLGIPRHPSPDPDGVREIAEHLLAAKAPYVVVGSAGRNPAVVSALVELCELLGLPVVDAISRQYLSFPFTHPLYQGARSLRDADVILVLEALVPWIPEQNDPSGDAYVAVVDYDPIKLRVPTYEFSANLRLVSGPLEAIRAITASVRKMLSESDERRIRERTAYWTTESHNWRERAKTDALARAAEMPIHPRWLSYQIGQIIDDNCIVIDESMSGNRVAQYLPISQPGSYFRNPGSAGGWSPGAALGAKLAAPDREVIALAGDGFYMFGTPVFALWAAAQHNAPYMQVVYQNRSYSTGTSLLAAAFPNSYAARSNFPGGYVDPPIDFAKEAEAAGAYGENVTEPGEIASALQRGRAAVRSGTPAVISVWLDRLSGSD